MIAILVLTGSFVLSCGTLRLPRQISSTIEPDKINDMIKSIADSKLSKSEEAALRQAEKEAQRTHRSLETFLSNELRQKRNSILKLEEQAVDVVFQVSKDEKSDARLDEYLQLMSEAVRVTGLDAAPNQSQHRMIKLVDGEQWTVQQKYRFGISDSLQRSQGVVTDGKSFWYSSKTGIIRTNSKTAAAAISNSHAIPKYIQYEGGDHIGDVDVADNKLYVSIEDSRNYLRPYVGVYEADSLRFLKSFMLSTGWQYDGVPWVAVDKNSHRLYSSAFDTAKINVYELETGQPLSQIELSQSIQKVQGAKVIDGMMYLSSDAKEKAVFKVNLSTGTVMKVASLDEPFFSEMEGISISKGHDGLEMNILRIATTDDALVPLLNVRSEILTLKMTAKSRREQLRQMY